MCICMGGCYDGADSLPCGWSSQRRPRTEIHVDFYPSDGDPCRWPSHRQPAPGIRVGGGLHPGGDDLSWRQQQATTTLWRPRPTHSEEDGGHHILTTTTTTTAQPRRRPLLRPHTYFYLDELLLPIA
uniref:Uncharacterized protein n=1 Tax=Triticum urartu TaxID=4572 RepID=A0A8R7Q4I2_TRIUA